MTISIDVKNMDTKSVRANKALLLDKCNQSTSTLLLFTVQDKSESLPHNYITRYERGFTLIELMIAMVLGLLIAGAAMAMFLGSSRGMRVQAASDDVQEAAVFSLSYLQKEIAMANLGAFTPMTQDSAWTGVVLTLSQDHPTEALAGGGKRQIGNLRGVNLTTAGLVTTQELDTTNNNNVGVDSDQITIQYRAPFDMFDCEGAARQKGQMVVERFFTRQDAVAPDGNAAFNIVLACDAGWYDLPEDISPSEVAKNAFTINDFGGVGEVLINRIDYFKIKLGVQREDGLVYMNIDDYMAKSGTTYTVNAPIVAVQIGALVRGVEPVGVETPTTFNVLGQDVTIADTSRKYVRRVYEHTIRLRNHNTLTNTP